MTLKISFFRGLGLEHFLGFNHLHRRKLADVPLGLMVMLTLLMGQAMIVNASAADSRQKILVFSKTAGFRHESITNGLEVIRELGITNNFEVVATEDASVFSDAKLAPYDAVVFLSTSGDVLEASQQAAFERHIRAGHGFVGIHAAADTELDWPWYGELVGARFSTHPAVQSAMVIVEDFAHPSTSCLPEGWMSQDEWYNFQNNPRTKVHVLCRLDEGSYSGGTMGGDHPIAWFHEYDGGRAWYTGMGHRPENFDDPRFRAHLLGGIRYAAGMVTPPAGALVLFDGKDTSQWLGTNNQTGIAWQVVDGALVVEPETGNIRTFQNFQDYRLHVEFLIPPSPAGTAEGALGNSGIFLQGLYEIQILDSYGRSLAGANDSGAIYSIRNASTNASYPAGTWETYDIVFRGGRWEGNQKLAHPRVSVWWNGVLVQDDQEIPRPTASTTAPDQPPPGSIMIQNYQDQVQFRNIWIEPLDPVPQGKLITFIQPGTTWRYKDDGSNQGTIWREPGFNDSSWATGRAQLGFGGNGETTLIRKARPDNSPIITSYFRKPFYASNVWSITNLTLRVIRDDGIIAYLNGVEVMRNNVPAGAVNFDTLAPQGLGGTDETTWIATRVNAALLREGENWLTVELHQASNTSDASFDAMLSGVTYPNPDLSLSRTNNLVTVAWPALPAGFRLESTANPADSNAWRAITATPVLSPNKQSKVTLDPPSTMQFYRLQR